VRETRTHALLKGYLYEKENNFIVSCNFLGHFRLSKRTARNKSKERFIFYSGNHLHRDEMRKSVRSWVIQGSPVQTLWGKVFPVEEALRRFMKDTFMSGFFNTALTDAEKEAATKVSPDFEEILIAFDGIAVVVNKNNPVIEMTTPGNCRHISGQDCEMESAFTRKRNERCFNACASRFCGCCSLPQGPSWTSTVLTGL